MSEIQRFLSALVRVLCLSLIFLLPAGLTFAEEGGNGDGAAEEAEDATEAEEEGAAEEQDAAKDDADKEQPAAEDEPAPDDGEIDEDDVPIIEFIEDDEEAAEPAAEEPAPPSDDKPLKPQPAPKVGPKTAPKPAAGSAAPKTDPNKPAPATKTAPPASAKPKPAPAPKGDETPPKPSVPPTPAPNEDPAEIEIEIELPPTPAPAPAPKGDETPPQPSQPRAQEENSADHEDIPPAPSGSPDAAGSGLTSGIDTTPAAPRFVRMPRRTFSALPRYSRSEQSIDERTARLEKVAREAEVIVFAEVVEAGKAASDPQRLRLRPIDLFKGSVSADGFDAYDAGAAAGKGARLASGTTWVFFLKKRNGRLELLGKGRGASARARGREVDEFRADLLKTPSMRTVLIGKSGDPADKAPLLVNLPTTLAIWEYAFNRRDLDWVIHTYSKHSALRKRYETGEAGRRGLSRDLDKFRGTVKVSLKDGRALQENRFEASVALLLTYDSHRETRSAVMTFVQEDGEWLILREGF